MQGFAVLDAHFSIHSNQHYETHLKFHHHAIRNLHWLQECHRMVCSMSYAGYYSTRYLEAVLNLGLYTATACRIGS